MSSLLVVIFLSVSLARCHFGKHNVCLNNLEFGVIKTNITDHYATCVQLDITISQSNRFQQTRATMPFLRNGYLKEKYPNYLRHCLGLSNLEQDVDRVTESLTDALTTTVNVFTIKEKLKVTKSKKPWFDKDVKKNIIRRNFAFNRYKRYRTPSSKTKYTKMSNRVCELMRSNNFIVTDNENKLNTDDFAISNVFNEKFVSISKTSATSIPTVPFTTEGL